MVRIHLLVLVLGALTMQASCQGGQSARQLFNAMDTFGGGQELTTGKLAEAPGEYAWGESYLLSAYIAMYEATKDARYLDKFVSRFRVMVTLRDDKTHRRDELRGKVMAAWSSTGYSGGKRTCWNVHAGMLTYPAARFARFVKEKKSLRKRYRVAAQEFTAAVEEIVAAFDPDWRDGPNLDEGYYVEPALGGKHLPLNQQNALGRTLLDLSAATGKKVYRDHAAKLAAFLKRRLRLRPEGAYDWAYWPALQPPYNQGSEDISHAAINVDFAVRCYQERIVFTKEDINHFVTTFLKVIYKGDNHFADNVGGGGGGSLTPQIGRWGGLAAADAQVARVLHDYFSQQEPPRGGATTMLALAILAKYGY